MKSGLRILIRALEVPFLGPPKRKKWVILGVFRYFEGIAPIEGIVNIYMLIYFLPLKKKVRKSLKMPKTKSNLTSWRANFHKKLYSVLDEMSYN